jgi:hypothetical protein
MRKARRNDRFGPGVVLASLLLIAAGPRVLDVTRRRGACDSLDSRARPRSGSDQ